jgi:hypothetical protein
MMHSDLDNPRMKNYPNVLFEELKFPVRLARPNTGEVKLESCTIAVSSIDDVPVVDIFACNGSCPDKRPFPRLEKVRFTGILGVAGQNREGLKDTAIEMVYAVGNDAYHTARIRAAGGKWDRRVAITCFGCDNERLPTGHSFVKRMTEICCHMTDENMCRLVGGHIAQEFGLQER